MDLFLQKPVLHHVFLHDFNGVSAVLGANVGPAILILSIAPQQFFSTQNYNLMAIYFFWSYTPNITNDQSNLKIT